MAELSHTAVSGADPRGRLPSLQMTLLLGAVVYALFWTRQTLDMRDFLLPWLRHIEARGPVGAFAQPFSNYSPPYLYLLAAVSPLAEAIGGRSLIKGLSVLGNLWLAFAVSGLLSAAGARMPARTAALVLVIPTVALNAALLGQCDAMWSAACVCAIACAIRRRLAWMLVWSGLAFALKAQAAFCAPFVVAVLIREKAPWRLWLIPPGVYLAAMLPAWLAGWPASDLATIYLRQAQWFDALSMNAPNIWAVVQQLEVPRAVRLDRIAFAAAGGGALVYVALFARRRLDPERMIAAALLASLLLPGLLPRMHERYFFLADVLAFALAAVARDRPAWLIFLAVQISSLMSLFAYFSGNGLNAVPPALTMIAATLAVAHRLGREATRPAGTAFVAA
ncbi:MAG TPA: hypothetical protein VF548_08515 [Allosphingosinicella sp.]|jgi:Gpi18-like mannosyltransferase